ncbi:MAG: FtsK/SpoIIIE domain-containing protein [Egibacteraceae bacterium]
MKLIERPPATPRRPGIYQPWEPPARRHPAVRLAGLLIGVAWRWRIELTAIAVAVTVWSWLAAVTSRPIAVILAAALIAAAVMPARARARLGWIEQQAKLRRRWGKACRHAGLETFNERTPRVTRIGRVPVGEVLRVRLPAGQNCAGLQTRAETLAAHLQVREVQVARDPDNARYAEVRLVRRDALAGTVRLAWPNLNTQRLCLWEPIPVGVDEHARTISISLVERNLLLGGEPGAGKSVAQSMLIATAALDPDVDLWLLDGKRVELAVWRDCARAFVGPSVDEAIDVLRQLQTEMEQRYELLLEQRRRKAEQGDGLRLHLVGCDELAFYTSGGERKAREEFNALCTDLIRRGRAAGIIWIGATQKPSADVVPTSLRDLVGYRWALRCSTRGASDTILGAGMATAGHTASDVAGDQRGVGLLIAEGEQPVRLRSFYLADDDLDILAGRARRLRGPDGEPRCAHCGGTVTDITAKRREGAA